MLPSKLQHKIDKRIDENSLRNLGKPNNLIDFSSNDYLGFSNSETIYNRTLEILKEHGLQLNGATGSRLLTGNHVLYDLAEKRIADYHQVEDALIFTSGYNANLGFFECVPQRNDLIFYDELCHASIRAGIQLSPAKAYKFKHNDLQALETQCLEQRNSSADDPIQIYIVTESVFSMDGDSPDLKYLVHIAKKYNVKLIIDEAHAVGVIGTQGEGLVQKLKLEGQVFARIVTFGKALGCHGAAILGSHELKQYLINFARSFIYTTGLSPHAVATIIAAYESLDKYGYEKLLILNSHIAILHLQIDLDAMKHYFVANESAIHTCYVSGNAEVKKVATLLSEKGFNVKPILSPTVPEGQERLRICLHSYNTHDQIRGLLQLLDSFTQ